MIMIMITITTMIMNMNMNMIMNLILTVILIIIMIALRQYRGAADDAVMRYISNILTQRSSISSVTLCITIDGIDKWPINTGARKKTKTFRQRIDTLDGICQLIKSKPR